VHQVEVREGALPLGPSEGAFQEAYYGIRPEDHHLAWEFDGAYPGEIHQVEAVDLDVT